jgi:hypothetical protein
MSGREIVELILVLIAVGWAVQTTYQLGHIAGLLTRIAGDAHTVARLAERRDRERRGLDEDE